MPHRETFERAPFIVTGLLFLEANIAVEILFAAMGGRGKKKKKSSEADKSKCV